ncbi:MAG: radical SAM protein, partial [Chitinivibrionales bacterium]|nr:radical SAM protein [Chitinivibrionales bacterium]
MGKQHTAWVDEFIANVRPYVFVRTEDNVLIKRPNRAQKLNPWGARILAALLAGHSFDDVLAAANADEARTNEILQFLSAVKASLENRIDIFTQSPAVELKPFEMAFSDYPVLSEVALTYRCNLRCRFCYTGCAGAGGHPSAAPEMRPKQVKRVLETIYHDARVPSVSFTGGEPTLSPALPELVAFAKRLGMRVNLITNGTLIDRAYAERLVRSGLDSAQVSLEAPDARGHDSLVSMDGAFERTVTAVGHLHGAGVHTHTNTTVTAANRDRCRELPRFVRETLGLERFSMNLLIPTGDAGMHTELLVRYSDIGAVLEEVMAESERCGVECMWYSPVPMCLFNTVANGLGNKGCSACDGLLSVAPNGDVLPCASVADSVGNLLR